MLSAESCNQVVLLSALVLGTLCLTLDEAFKKHRTSKVFSSFSLKTLNEALYAGLDKMFKNNLPNKKLLALDMVQKFVMDVDQDPGTRNNTIDIEFPTVKREESSSDASKADEMRKKCLSHFYKAMSTETLEIRLKAIDKLVIEPSNPEQNFSLLIERLKDQEMVVRIAMIKKLRASRVTFIQLTSEEIYQALTYCMITRDAGELC